MLTGRAGARALCVIACAAGLALLAACDAPPLSDDLAFTTAWRGHVDFSFDDDALWHPIYAGARPQIGACLTTAAHIDTGNWTARVRLGNDRGDWHSPVLRNGATLCFEREVTAPNNGKRQLCLEVTDGATNSGACTVAAFRIEDPLDYNAQLNAALQDTSTDERQRKLQALTDQLHLARRYGQSVRTQLIGAHFARQAGATDEVVLAPEPPVGWREANVATSQAAQLHYENATRALARGALDVAYLWVREARTRFDQTVDAKRIVAATREAHILHRAGAEREAQTDLAKAIDTCAQSCAPHLARDARNALAWWLMHDPATSNAQRQQARALLIDALVGTDGVDRANVLINLGLLDAAERVHGAHLDQADALLAHADGSRAQQLRQWAAFARLQARSDEAALEGLNTLAQQSVAPALAVHLWRAIGRHKQHAGDRAGARHSFARVVEQHAQMQFDEQWLRPTPGQQAVDVLRLALSETRLGEPAVAWERLATLGRAVTAPPCLPARTERDNARLREVEAALAALEMPASVARQRQRVPERERLERQQRALLRQLDACTGQARSTAGLRAFVVDDQLVVLRQHAQGVRAEHVGPLPARALHRALEQLDRLALNRADDGAWRAAAQPIADLLAPLIEVLLRHDGPIALHGALQRVRLAALPHGERWLGDQVDVRLALPSRRAAAVTNATARPLFVVDPSNNLPSGPAAAASYARLFPAANVLLGESATKRAVASAVAEAGFLHIDAHGQARPGFEALFSLEMADGALTTHRLVTSVRSLAFANLSGCGTALGQVTVDAGHFGLAGELVRAGVPWVVGARSDISDAAAAEFNAVFYETYRGNGDVPAAYRTALRALRGTKRASDWSGLVLLRGAPGQNRQQRTPTAVRPTESGARDAAQLENSHSV